jgi:GH25 family lysozyme M1 (1,4-beta-N-acetylmuramidase)
MYHKATEGSDFRDSNYIRRREECKNVKLPFGAYHFARPSSGNDALTEARFFISVAKPVVGDLRPALDLEVKDEISGPALVRWADDFCNEVQMLTGVVPVVYTPYLLSEALEKKAIIWVPRYNNDNRPPERSWDIWQFSNGLLGVPNSVPGLGHVDLNHSKVPLSAIRIPKPTPPTPPKPDPEKSRGPNVDIAVDSLTKAEKFAKDGGKRDTLIKRALRSLKRIKPR